MDIVIGYQGKDHVKAEQLRRMIAGMAGDGTYVLGTQNELAATMVTANQVRIDTGDVVAAGGAYATVETPETLTIESGVTGQKRNDIVVARYEKDASTNVESMELAVVKGTPVSYGEPTDPELADGSIMSGDSPVEVPLWRIPIDGLAPGTPVKLFDTIPTIDSLRDSVSQLAERPPRLFAGSKVVSFTANQGILFLPGEYESIVGRRFSQSRDCVCLMNGDSGASGWWGLSTTYNPENGYLLVIAERFGPTEADVSGLVRVNYVIAAG